MLSKQSSHFRWPASVPGLQEVAFLRAAGRAGPWLCLGLFPPDQQSLWAPRSLPPQSLVPRPSSVKGPHPPPARPASALSRFSGTCAQRAEYRARGEEEGSLSHQAQHSQALGFSGLLANTVPAIPPLPMDLAPL